MWRCRRPSVRIALPLRRTPTLPRTRVSSRRGTCTAGRSLEIIGAHSVPTSFRYASALHLRGAALLSARRAAEALPDLTRAAETVRQALGPLHDVTRTYQADRALAMARLGRHGEAEQLIQKIVPQGPRPEDRPAARLRYVLGVVKRLQGEYRDALRLQQQLLDSMRDGEP